MSSPKTDILVLGATGFTGRLITRYLASHPQRSQFTFCIAGRSTTKLQELAQELGLKVPTGTAKDPEEVPIVRVDVTDEEDVRRAVQDVRVVINTVGPFLKWGTKVVRACVKAGVHYVDLTGETAWIVDIISELDYLATKTGSIIVPSSGYDSLPSDYSAYISSRTAHAYASKTAPSSNDRLTITSSTTAHDFKGGISGGTIGTIVLNMSELSREKRRRIRLDYVLSPITGAKAPRPRLLYKLFTPGFQPFIGTYFVMRAANKPNVERTFGLLQLADMERKAAKRLTNSGIKIQQPYGRTFKYDEFRLTASTTSAVITAACMVVILGLFAFVPPVRWVITKLLPPGSGPSEQTMQNGSFSATNITKAEPTPGSSSSLKPVTVKTVMRGKGDPGYLATSVMISEAALCLILPSTSRDDDASATKTPKHALARRRLPELAQTGGVLTPVTAFGDVLEERLKASGRFTFESEVIEVGGEVVRR